MSDSHVASNVGSQGYLSRSWHMLTAEPGWYKPILVLAAVCCIPVVGSFLGLLAVLGYALEWARLTAWGIDAVPKQRGVNIGGILSSGWRAFLVGLVWSLALAFASALITALLGMLGLGFVGGLLQIAASVFLGLLTLIASLRAAIYQRFGAGFGVRQMIEMIRRDTSGAMKVFGLNLLGTLLMGFVTSVLLMAVLASLAPSFLVSVMPYIDSYRAYGTLNGYEATQVAFAVISMLAGAFPAFALFKFLFSLVSVPVQLLVYTSCGLWFRQFDVPSWGSPSDPLPAQADTRGSAPTV